MFGNLAQHRVLVTGSAGFIGAAVARALLVQGAEVVGIDNHNDYYSPQLKELRLSRLQDFENYQHHRMDIADSSAIHRIFADHPFSLVVNLAAQAGVRYSIENPALYAQTNVVGFTNVISAAALNGVQNFIYASSSSVYGANEKLPFSESDEVSTPLSIYAATKRANELIAHSFGHLYGLPSIGLRFFTVYGPWGRPDMALYKFTKAIMAGERIQLFNSGRHKRDFTFIDDIVDGVLRAIVATPTKSAGAQIQSSYTSTSNIYNLGNGMPVDLLDYIEAIEEATGKKALLEMLPLQKGDVMDTFADIGKARSELGYSPQTSVRDGVAQFVEWFRSTQF